MQLGWLQTDVKAMIEEALQHESASTIHCLSHLAKKLGLETSVIQSALRAEARLRVGAQQQSSAVADRCGTSKMSEDVTLRNNIICHAWTETGSDKGEHIEAALKEVYGGAKAEAQKTRGDPVWSPAITALLYSVCVCLEHARTRNYWGQQAKYGQLIIGFRKASRPHLCKRLSQ